MYDRSFGDRTLSFEASGALWQASLVMRDRETDSWWSIISSDAIGGALAGTELVELPYGEKTTWADWVARHPGTLVLSVDGREHLERNPYADYFANDKTFRGLKVADERLAPKTPVFAFLVAGEAWAAPHDAVEGGAVFALEGGGRAVLHRPEGAPLFASTRAWLAPPGAGDPLASVASGADLAALGYRPLAGIDTFWYNWAAIHRDSRILR